MKSNAEIIGLEAAAKLAGVSHQAVREWCIKYGIGRQLENHRWIISKPGLMRVVKVRRDLKSLRHVEP